MCGRFTLATPAEEWAALFELDEAPDLPARYNIAPTQEIAAVRRPPGTAGPGREAALVRWGLVPHWTREPAADRPLINARAETVAEKPSFRDSFRDRRCLIPADGFYEWREEGGRKQPYWVHKPDRTPFAFAGLWDRWERDGEEPLESGAILTTEANEALQPLHDRMPVIVPRDAWTAWLDPETPPWELDPLLHPPAPDALVFHPVSRRVNYVDNDAPDLIERDTAQRELFR